MSNAPKKKAGYAPLPVNATQAEEARTLRAMARQAEGGGQSALAASYAQAADALEAEIKAKPKVAATWGWKDVARQKAQ
ncbi:MAG TPA: hypothetical protein VGK67_31545 [Myxococcales bacterium]|jgi:hypothetical protein